MAENDTQAEQAQQVVQENQGLMTQLGGTLKAGAEAIVELRRMLKITYWVVIVLSIIMFLIGVVLLSVPVTHGFQQLRAGTFKGENWTLSIVSGGLGIVDFVTLFFFRPVDRIRRLMGDFSQLTVILNTYQTCVGLRLLESKLDDRSTVGEAAVHVNAAAKDCLELIDDYFENETRPQGNPPADGANPGEGAAG